MTVCNRLQSALCINYVLSGRFRTVKRAYKDSSDIGRLKIK